MARFEVVCGMREEVVEVEAAGYFVKKNQTLVFYHCVGREFNQMYARGFWRAVRQIEGSGNLPVSFNTRVYSKATPARPPKLDTGRVDARKVP